jgi:hypothetical protein
MAERVPYRVVFDDWEGMTHLAFSNDFRSVLESIDNLNPICGKLIPENSRQFHNWSRADQDIFSKHKGNFKCEKCEELSKTYDVIVD